MDYTDRFIEAMALPTAQYRTVGPARIQEGEAVLIDMDCTGVTNAASQIPVIGTSDFNPCTCLIAYNKRTRTAALTHLPFPDASDVFNLIDKVRYSEEDRVEMHVIGAAISDETDKHAKDGNEIKVDHLEATLQGIESSPNVTLKTFDVYDKPKPYAVAIDTRNGSLIRGSELVVAVNESDFFPDIDFDWPIEIGDFDGTIPEMQSERYRE